MLQKWAKYMNRHVAKEDIYMADNHMKIFPKSFVIKELQENNQVTVHIYQNGKNPF